MSDTIPPTPYYSPQAHLKRIQELHAAYELNTEEKCARHASDFVVNLLRRYPDHEYLADEIINLTVKLFEDEDFYRTYAPTIPLPNFFKRLELIYSSPEMLRSAEAALAQFLEGLFSMLPTLDTTTPSPKVELISLMKHADELAQGVFNCFAPQKFDTHRVYHNLADTLGNNAIRASGYDPGTYDGKRKVIGPSDYDGSPLERCEAFLAHTPFLRLIKTPVPFTISKETQYAHTWVVAGSGHGKTTALTSMIHEHIPDVLKGEASIVLIDSQAALIPALSRLKVWEGSDRLIIVDPSDPVGISLFQLPWPHTPQMIPHALEMISFVFSSLAGGQDTSRQRNIFRYVSQFLITSVPNATIHDFRDMLDPVRAKRYDQYIENAPEEVRDFLERDFVKEKFTVDARAQVLTKMRETLNMPAFMGMFGSGHTKLDLFKELERGTCILIRPDQFDLGEEATLLFGRFWIAQMRLLAMQRQKATKKTPTFFYIDEAQDYLRGGDPKIEGILEQARKQNIGLTLLHHTSAQLKAGNDFLSLLGACTATKICGSLDNSDLSRFATYLQCEPRFIAQQHPRQSFAAHVRGMSHAISLRFPYIDLAKEPQISEAAYQAMLARNRVRYGADVQQPRSPPITPPPLPVQPPPLPVRPPPLPTTTAAEQRTKPQSGKWRQQVLPPKKDGGDPDY